MLQGRHGPAERGDHREAAGDDGRHLHRRLADSDHRGGGHAPGRVNPGVVEATDDDAGDVGMRLHRVQHRGDREHLVVVPLDALRTVLGGDGDDLGPRRDDGADAASRILTVIEAVVLGLTRSSFIAGMIPCCRRGWKRPRSACPCRYARRCAGSGPAGYAGYTIPAPASVPCLIRRRRSRVMKKRLSRMTRKDTPVVTVPSA